jgi:hypothetical protein
VRFAQTAVFWFGRISPVSNYADVRVGYNDAELYVHVSVFDRRLWYAPAPSPEQLSAWDTVTLHLSLNDHTASAPGVSDYEFTGQLNWWEMPRDRWQSVRRGNGSGWSPVTLAFNTETGWQGDAPNDDVDDRGWWETFHIPFASLGLSGLPAQTSRWRMALAVHDRDDHAGTPIPDQVWPENASSDVPASWGQLVFGLPTYVAPPAGPGDVVTIRQGLDGAVVPDGMVGGGTTCGEGFDYWTQWGNANYAGRSQVNVQNQGDVADWPCFSKYFITFPLSNVPAGKTIISAALVMHQFGNPGVGWTPPPEPSYIQVLTVSEPWTENTLTWNSAPLAVENVGGAWVDPLTAYAGQPGVARTWDVSMAAAQAYQSGLTLNLVLYSADWAYHSGRYFWSSETDNSQPTSRPTLLIRWGEPVADVRQTVRPVAPASGGPVTYTISFFGLGKALTLTDSLPAQMSAPLRLEVSGGPPANYVAQSHRLTWNGAPGLGQPVTITIEATVLGRPRQVVSNTAWLTDADGRVSSATSVFIVDAIQIWLPSLHR